MRLELRKARIILGAILAIGLVGGCSGKSKDISQVQQEERIDNFVDRLRQARFKGRAWVRLGGSPLAFHMTQSFEVGSKQSDMGFEGDMDFTQAPRKPEGP